MKEKNQFDVIIIGGGITGAGTARDCAKRGLKTLLFEKSDFATGATGRNHGLLHSGARYAVSDFESAKECISENMILRRIARHCVEETDGLFISLPEDGLEYQANFVKSCTEAGIRAEIIDPKEAMRLEPSVNDKLIGAVRVPDGSVDPFRLTIANVLDAKNHGAIFHTYHKVTKLIIENGRVIGVEALDVLKNETVKYYANIVINAAGIWGHLVAELAGIKINMFPAKGSLLIFGHRVNQLVINRCRKPSNADILVPGDVVSVIGTTSSRVGYDEIDNIKATIDEVQLLIEEGSKLVPSLLNTRILRAYAGVRPLVADDSDPSGRTISRGIVCLDHETRDGLAGFITITGGKLMTYRLMAEWATDLACKKLNIDKKCTTAVDILPGSEPNKDAESGKNISKSALYRHGSRVSEIVSGNPYQDSLICECEEVTVGEVEYAIEHQNAHNLVSLRRRTRIGMGTCQGELCACRAAGLLAKSNKCAENAKIDLARFIQERWKGCYPVGWGSTMCENQLTSMIYQGVCGLTSK